MQKKEEKESVGLEKDGDNDGVMGRLMMGQEKGEVMRIIEMGKGRILR